MANTYGYYMKRWINIILIYMDINTETTVIKIYSSETNAFAKKIKKHGSCTHTWHSKQVLYVQVAPCEVVHQPWPSQIVHWPRRFLQLARKLLPILLSDVTL